MDYVDIENPNDLYYFVVKNINYGFVTQNNEIFLRKDSDGLFYMEELMRNYKLQSPEELLLTKCGLCYDQNELMKKWLLEHGYDVKTYYSNIRNHSFVVYKEGSRNVWIETSYKRASGIYKFMELEDLFDYYLVTQRTSDPIEVYEYNIEKYGCDFYDFVTNAKQSKLVLKK